MTRFAPVQPDLFAPAELPLPPDEPRKDPLTELRELLALVRGATELPWDGLSEAMQQELRALHLAKLSGDEGKALVQAIFQETERIFSTAEQAAMEQALATHQRAGGAAGPHLTRTLPPFPPNPLRMLEFV
jgi:hypothetical protein